jgi:DNA-directed RNA polymerase subunit RPC12/RpoP
VKRHWLCNLIGHRYDDLGRWFYYVDRCHRCGAEEPDPASLQPWHMRWLGRWWCGLKLRVHDEWQKKTAWWHRCSDCGYRFGRHDPDQEHLPF